MGFTPPNSNKSCADHTLQKMMVNEEEKQFNNINESSSESASQYKAVGISKIARLAFISGISSNFLIGLAYGLLSYEAISCFMMLFVPLTAIAGIVLGLTVLFNAKSLKGNKKPLILALAGILIPVVGFASVIYFFIYPFFLEVKQRAEFLPISLAIEYYNSNFNNFPSSGAIDPIGKPYCGAMKLCEAFLGQDLKGFNKESVFRSDGLNSDGTINLYPDNPEEFDPTKREKPNMTVEQVNANRLKDIFENTGPFDGNNYILCDVYKKRRYSDKEIGMPILYYKTDLNKSSHDIDNPDNPDNIYNYKDNYDLLALGVPGKPGVKHPLYEDPSLFYIMTQNTMAKSIEPYNKVTYILISAGKDGLYGTSDDIANFDFKWRPKKEIKK